MRCFVDGKLAQEALGACALYPESPLVGLYDLERHAARNGAIVLNLLVMPSASRLYAYARLIWAQEGCKCQSRLSGRRIRQPS